MFKGKGFEVILSSDDPYEHMCAEIYFDGKFIAIITQEEGLENAKIDFDSQKCSFNYSEFLTTLNKAKDLLRN